MKWADLAVVAVGAFVGALAGFITWARCTRQPGPTLYDVPTMPPINNWNCRCVLVPVQETPPRIKPVSAAEALTMFDPNAVGHSDHRTN